MTCRDCVESEFLASALSREHLGGSAVKPLTAGVLSYNRKNFMFDKAGNPSIALRRFKQSAAAELSMERLSQAAQEQLREKAYFSQEMKIRKHELYREETCQALSSPNGHMHEDSMV